MSHVPRGLPAGVVALMLVASSAVAAGQQGGAWQTYGTENGEWRSYGGDIGSHEVLAARSDRRRDNFEQSRDCLALVGRSMPFSQPDRRGTASEWWATTTRCHRSSRWSTDTPDPLPRGAIFAQCRSASPGDTADGRTGCSTSTRHSRRVWRSTRRRARHSGSSTPRATRRARRLDDRGTWRQRGVAYWTDGDGRRTDLLGDRERVAWCA